jgi:lipopolysaccharide/colanic/teichoic acid biosynthesis glycosyltransferase
MKSTRTGDDLTLPQVIQGGSSAKRSLPFIEHDMESREKAREWQLFLKRTMDVVVSALFLVLLMPLFLVIAVAIKLTSPGPVLYKWHVVGKNGKPFTSYKFRTMVLDADKMKQQLLEGNEMTGPVFKMKDDPRITPVGRVLRMFSVDELPQLWSILKGDMSLVGPRPPLAYEVEKFEDWHLQKLSAQPGAVSLWHVAGKPKDFDEWVRLDLKYINNWSLWLDIRILVKIIPYVLLGKNC